MSAISVIFRETYHLPLTRFEMLKTLKMMLWLTLRHPFMFTLAASPLIGLFLLAVVYNEKMEERKNEPTTFTRIEYINRCIKFEYRLPECEWKWENVYLKDIQENGPPERRPRVFK